ncbi:MAG: NTP transferase domain-containing protein [Propionibacteriales bacterium]|nr:NTP transferase domain-containing protein [Propionibacteriales bacterium]
MVAPGRVAGLLLAAGAGLRLGQPKALVRDGDGTTFVERAVGALVAAGADPVVVVVGAEADRVTSLAPAGCVIVEAGDWTEGMGASLRAGLAELTLDHTCKAVVLMLVDTPGIGADVVRRLANGADATTLARATYDGVPGHPVVIGRDHWHGVLDVAAGDRGARDYLQSRDVALVECRDIGSGDDLDTLAALGEWRRMGDSG